MTQPLGDWIGRTEERSDRVDARPARHMQALLNLPVDLADGAPLPTLWHWLYFTPETPTKDLGPDGHPRRGGFLPPVPLPRRMWAGGRFSFLRPLSIGETATRRSTITNVTEKSGKSGDMVFVTVRHDIDGENGPALREEHDIVYRALPDPDADLPPAPTPPAAPEVSETVTPSMPLLFRYSALTFNAHRIHYDLDHCREVEGYPGCIVHGPLTATMLAALAERRLGRRLRSFAFRATAPLFHDRPFTLNASGDTFWAATPDGGQAMRATAD